MSLAKFRWNILLACLTLTTAVAVPALAQHHGDGEEPRSRLLLVFAPDENNQQLLDQYKTLQRDMNEIDGSDIDVVYVIGDHMVKLPPPDMKTESGDELRKHYHVDATGFRVVLIGKDGWEKTRWSAPTPTGTILDHAQDMPKPKSALDDKK